MDLNEEGLEVWTIEPEDSNLPDLQVPIRHIRLIKKAEPPINKYLP